MDVVKRLRLWVDAETGKNGRSYLSDLVTEAATEIEHLRADVASFRYEGINQNQGLSFRWKAPVPPE